MGKYAPLSQFLRNATGIRIRLTFTQVEQVVGAPLPPSARRYREWWGNDRAGGHVQARAWLSAGWEVSAVDFAGGEVEFIKR